MNFKRIILSITLLFVSVLAFSGVVIVEGTYQGKNLYVQNPFAGSGIGFCVYEITVNGDVTTDEFNSSAFEIDFAAAGIEIGTAVVVKLKHKDDCRPKVLNSNVLKAQSTFNVVAIRADKKTNELSWTTKDESGALPFVVEQFRWNKWVKIGEVVGEGTPEEHNYKVLFSNFLHSGLNQFRVKQVDFSKRPNVSSTAKLRTTILPITINGDLKKISNELTFSAATMYELYDQYGSLLKKGQGDTIDLSAYPKGTYYLNYDNKSEKFDKRK